MAPYSPPFDPETVGLMRRAVEEVWEQVAPDFKHFTLEQIIAARERIATSVLCYSRMGVRDPLVLRAMGLAAVKIYVDA